jgi:hypothetical protein
MAVFEDMNRKFKGFSLLPVRWAWYRARAIEKQRGQPGYPGKIDPPREWRLSLI